MNTSLYALRTDHGYGLLHWFEHDAIGSAYLMYYTQIPELSEREINSALAGDYYYQRICDMIIRLQYHMNETLKKNQGVEFDLEKLDNRGIISTSDYANCFMTYLGEYELPSNATHPEFLKRVSLYYYTGKYEWLICDRIKDRDISVNGKVISFKKITPEIAEYPDYGFSPITEILYRFNIKFRLSDFNDQYAEALLEERYQEEPYLRPTKEKYDDVKRPFPTVRWREFEDIDDDYLKFCDAVECALDEFITSIDANRKAVSKPLCALLTKLNKISAVHPIDSLEQEELYDYIVKILQTLRKAQLIDRIDNIREW
jgi:hypothetical protein